MKAKNLIIVAASAICAAAVITYLVADSVSEPTTPREPASVPANYESLKACEKQDVLWQRIRQTEHRALPALRDFGALQLLAMSKQEVGLKGSNHSDFAPKGWKKYLHGRGSIAKVRIVPRDGAYTGAFQGADCGLLRLSLTYRPRGSRPVAPGLALKILRDGIPSANVSALVSLEGQGKDFNLFRHPMSNIVPVSAGFGQILVHRIFKRASSYPEELGTADLAGFDVHGAKVAEASVPRQLFFVPGDLPEFVLAEHDFREDLSKIPAGTTIYSLYAAPEKYRDFNYAEDYENKDSSVFLKESRHIADIVTTSEFIASEFGDDGIFFRHQLRP